MIKHYKKLTKSLIMKYMDISKLGITCFFYDLKEDSFIPLPKDVEHIDLACKILGISRKELEKNPGMAERFIPVTYFIRTNHITSEPTDIYIIQIGYCGLELEKEIEVRHEKKDLKKAYGRAFLFASHINKAKDFAVRVEYRFSK